MKSFTSKLARTQGPSRRRREGFPFQGNDSLKGFPFQGNDSLKGFTLIELLVVFAIIGILAAVVMAVINPVEIMRKGRDSTRLTDLENVRKAVDITITQGALLPDTLGNAYRSDVHGRQCSSSCGVGGGWVCGMNICDALGSLPVDPTNSVTYHYEFQADGSYYELRMQLESSSNDFKEQNDGGSDVGWYEVGTDLWLIQ